MKNLLAFFIIVFSGLTLQAQSIYNHQAIMSGGQTASAGGYYLVSAVGELAVREVSQSGYHISEGFINPDIAGNLEIDTEQMLEDVSVYPNPVENILNISMKQSSDYEIKIFDLSGKMVFETGFSGTDYQIQPDNLSRATYMLVITDKKTAKAKVFKLTKK